MQHQGCCCWHGRHLAAASAVLLLLHHVCCMAVRVLLLVVQLVVVPRVRVQVVRVRSRLLLMLPMLCMLPMLRRVLLPMRLRRAVRRGVCSMRGVRSMRSVQHSGVAVVQLGQAGDHAGVQSAGLKLGSRLLPLCVLQALQSHEGIHSVAEAGRRRAGERRLSGEQRPVDRMPPSQVWHVSQQGVGS